MKFGDVFKIALHNLWHNKSRTVLTVIIVTIVSSLIMALCLLGIAFIQNQTDVSKIVFETRGTTYSAESRYERRGESTSYYKPYTQNEIAHIDAAVEEYKHIVDTVTYSIENICTSDICWQYYAINGSTEDILTGSSYIEMINQLNRYGEYFYLYNARFADFGMYNVPKENLIKEGRLWTQADKNTPNIWLNADYIRTLQKRGITVKIGDKLTVCTLLQAERGTNDTSVSDLNFRTAEYSVCGIFDPALLKTSDWDRSPVVIADGAYFMRQFAGTYDVIQVEMTYRPPQTDYDYNAVYSDMKALTERMNEGLETYLNWDDKEVSPFSCSYVEEMRMTVLMSIFIMAVVIILGLLILILSVGSVANTIIISVDKNRKFIGLMKAMGLNQRGVKKIVTCESLVQIILGVLVGVAVLFLLQPVVLSLMESMFASMFAYYEVEFAVSVRIPFYLPMVTALLFFLFASLFSRGSLGKIARQDVISTISEVA